ncbi:hypothetical protein AAFF_G00309610 [Aldrovandia affinis]|uniref:Uncharacterized protein n=1 Tax=Aldrovandia affinis TaxID=143900 RepID=A0AAD7SP85_9TELE|nr:hypothetical protein AAFF_G00309610 [Aldrovandia affinis]
MKKNILPLNSSKTEALLVGTPHQVQHFPITHLTITGQKISLSSSISNLGIRFDPSLTFGDHTSSLQKLQVHPEQCCQDPDESVEISPYHPILASLRWLPIS